MDSSQGRARVEDRWREEAPPQRELQRESRREPQREPQREVRREARREPPLQEEPPILNDDLTEDLWDDSNKQEELIEVQKPLNIPKKKVMEYEEETDY